MRHLRRCYKIRRRWWVTAPHMDIAAVLDTVSTSIGAQNARFELTVTMIDKVTTDKSRLSQLLLLKQPGRRTMG